MGKVSLVKERQKKKKKKNKVRRQVAHRKKVFETSLKKRGTERTEGMLARQRIHTLSRN